MKYKYLDKEYNIKIIRKNNKNTYIRVNDDLDIVVTTSYFAPEFYIKKVIAQNSDSVNKMLNRKKKEQEKEEEFYYLGKKYDIIIVPTIDKVEINDNFIYIKNKKAFLSWYKKEMETLFKERLDFYYNIIEEKIPYPKLKFRKMKTRWGVCNKRDNSVTLNTLLMKERIECLDYVIVHELSHFIHFDHSKSFWSMVEKYCKDYKNIRKSMRK